MTCDDFINYDRTSAQTLVTASRGRAEVILQTLNHLAHHRILVSSHSVSPVTLSPCRSWPAAITFPVFRVSVKTHQRKCLCKHNIMLWERWSRLKATQRKDNRGESVESVPPAPSGSGRRPACPGVCRCVDMLVCRRCICICTFVFIALCDQVCESDSSPAAACWARWTVWCPVCFCSVWPVPFTSACWPQLTEIASFFYKTRRLFSWLIICRLFPESIDKSFSFSESNKTTSSHPTD